MDQRCIVEEAVHVQLRSEICRQLLLQGTSGHGVREEDHHRDLVSSCQQPDG